MATIRKPLPTFEEDYAKYVERKARVEEEVRAEFELELAKRTKVLNELIALVSFEEEVPETIEEYTCEELGE